MPGGKRTLNSDGKFINSKSEKTSVSAIVAQNNETLSKLISGERTKLGFSGKNAKIVAFENAQKEASINASELMAEIKAEEGDFNLKRDILASQAIEREQNVKQDLLRQELSVVAPGDDVSRAYDLNNVGENQPKPVFEEKPGIQFHSNATYTDATGTHRDALGQAITTDMNVNKITDDVAFAAQKSIIEDVALEKSVLTEKAESIDSHKYNRDRKGQIITDTPAHNQLHSEVTSTVEDYTISGTAQKAIIADEKITKDTKDSALQAKQLGNSTELNAEKDAATEVFMSNYNDDQVFNPSFDEALSNEILNTTDKDLEKSSGVAFEKAQKEAAKNAAELMAEMKKDNELTAYKAEQNKQAEERIASALEASKQEGIKQSALQREKDVEKRIKDIKWEEYKKRSQKRTRENFENTLQGQGEAYLKSEEEKANAEAKSNALKEQTLQSLAEARETERKLKDNANTTPLGENADKEKERLQSKERLESNASTTPLGQNFGLKEEADRKLAKEKEEQRLYEQQINSETSDNIAGESSFYNQQRGTGGKDRGAFRKLQAEKKAAKAKADAVVNASENAFQEDNGAVNVRSMMRGGANDPYHFTTLSYPPDAVNSQENGHFMLFYVNVQNKTKYEYNGYKNGNVVPVGGQVGTRIAATPAYEHLGDGTNYKAIPAKTVYTNDARESGLITDVEYQKQMIRNGGKGNIIYNNQKVLQKGRKSPGQNLASKYPTTTRITDSVALYLPSGIGNTTSVTYGDFETGIAGYAVMSGIDFGKSIQEEDFVGAATQLFDKSKTLIKDAVKNLTLKGLETLGGGEGLTQNFDKIFGQTLNPYIEVAFQSSGMRTFDYTFKFAPKSKAETDEVKAIINLFRFHMLPEMKGTSSRYLTLPSTFDIHYMWQSGRTTAKENSFYNKIATCVLTNVDVNYTPNGEVQSFGDGAPTEISMRLSFKETEMMTKQHVNEGF